jgi:hypothetical protein
MTRLDDYHSAMLAGLPDVTVADCERVLDAQSSNFPTFITDHGLGPLWHERTGRSEFRESRVAAEALYALQEHALREIDGVLGEAGVEYAVFKGAATRLLAYENPAVRACHDLDLLVRPNHRVKASHVLVDAGFEALPETDSISRELVLSRGGVNIDLHWGLLREGRLRSDPVPAMLDRRCRSSALWMLDDNDAFFTLLVHPAFAKHLAGWEMGLHRVLDIVLWLKSRSLDWSVIRPQLAAQGVRTAAWATLSWVSMLTSPQTPDEIKRMLGDLQPGRSRSAWIECWLRGDLPAKTSSAHWARLFGFSLLLHDTTRDAVQALLGRYRAHRRQSTDLAAFQDLLGEQAAPD